MKALTNAGTHRTEVRDGLGLQPSPVAALVETAAAGIAPRKCRGNAALAPRPQA